MRKLWFVVLTAVLFCCKKNATDVSKWEVTSPDESVALRIFLDSGQIAYEVQRIEGEKRRTVIERSPLGIA